MSDCRQDGRAVPAVGGVKVLRRWNRAKRGYEPYEVPASWNVSCHEAAMDVTVNCAGCGRAMPYGETYTSLEIHTRNGFGYGVCADCYDEEMARERRSR